MQLCFGQILILATLIRNTLQSNDNEFINELNLSSLADPKHTLILKPSLSGLLSKRDFSFSLSELNEETEHSEFHNLHEFHSRDKRQVDDDCPSCVQGPVSMCHSRTRTTFPRRLTDVFGNRQVILNVRGILEQPVVETVCLSGSCNLVHGNCTQDYREQSLIIVLPPSEKCTLSLFKIKHGCSCQASIYPPDELWWPRDVIIIRTEIVIVINHLSPTPSLANLVEHTGFCWAKLWEKLYYITLFLACEWSKLIYGTAKQMLK